MSPLPSLQPPVVRHHLELLSPICVMPCHFQRGWRISEHLFSFGHRAPPTYTMAAPLHPLPTHGRAPPKSPPWPTTSSLIHRDHLPKSTPFRQPSAARASTHTSPPATCAPTSRQLGAAAPLQLTTSILMECFPNPKEMVNDLHSIGFKVIWMLDPGIKKEEGYFVYDSGSSNDLWIQNADGEPFSGEVWPGPCVFPDFTREQTCSWWGKLVRDFISNGVDGICNDMNEPALFKTVTKTMPGSNIHQGDPELGGVHNHSYYHNRVTLSQWYGCAVVTLRSSIQKWQQSLCMLRNSLLTSDPHPSSLQQRESCALGLWHVDGKINL